MDKLYISGDLVMTKTEPNNFIPNGVVCKFNEYIFRDKVFVSTVMLADNFTCKKEDIAPIPLTPEILEKNGWKLSHGFYWSPNEEGAGVGLKSQTGYVWEAYFGRHLLRSNINSVSDLQHLIFGLGLNSEMEV